MLDANVAMLDASSSMSNSAIAEAVDASSTTTGTGPRGCRTDVDAAVAPAALTTTVVPSLVIDDARSRQRGARARGARADRTQVRRSFLPPILLDRDDRSARQGGLTLAVIILLIAATLTLSYLMRRPSSTGDGMTMRDVPGRAS